ncbi:hypothetical protein [Noviherbaspirillum aridicola]|uniref:Proline-rich protein n=1 Tax=Noviherbaspirillum aridicola TaxID=2849687 RepID=A0ABQ4Q221_9BURK|nr:hypothetical protein [Noviherbaspirillum aridicola]GIZ51233.1 hypothetical protein NCCP691_12470 [Noviherbaspirillum aridicola]
MTAIYDKTDKGREEIASRRYGLSSRLRPLLVMIDGKKAANELLDKVAGLGLGADSLAELADGGYIHAIAQPEPAPPPAAPAPAAEPAPAETAAPDNRFMAVYQFYNETIKSMIGLRGYALQLKVEKASSLDELRQLRQPYLDAVQKAKGNETARSLRDRLDRLLGAEEKQPNSLVDLGA